jgi:AraC-like DNA-binding protein
MSCFRSIYPGVENLPANFNLPRHRHLRAYATVVLGGAFEEAGYAGRIQASVGDLLIHPILDCHVDRMITPGLRLLRLPWPDAETTGGFHRLSDLDQVVRIAEKDILEAQMLLLEITGHGKQTSTPMDDWFDMLAHDIKSNPTLSIGEWADNHGMARETVSRGFSRVWGIPPASFRAEWRARTAWLRLTSGNECLSAVASGTGFADQAHMTRWISRTTGSTPAIWKNWHR